ncbi:MAG TPA: glutathione peroxidase [Candidatus Nanopelagicales bacterium]|jgi:glutathione peroxidase
MTLHDVPLVMLDGRRTTFGEFAGRAVLVVNVASKCGFTPQYAGLEALAEGYADRGLTVLGVPCNQFGAQEPGSNEQIEQFCSLTYGVTFPMTDKVDVNGEDRDPLFAELVRQPDQRGRVGDVTWNFEKWLVSPEGDVVGRFAPKTEPDDVALVRAIEAVIPG